MSLRLIKIMEKFYNKLFKNTLSIALTVVISVLVIVSVIWAATTIGANVDTEGTLTVDTTSTLTGVVTTGGDVIIGADATVTDVLVVGASTVVFELPTSTLTVIGSAHFTGTATTSDAIWIGAGGTADNINLAGGDLYVQNDVEIDGTIYLTQGETIANATNNNITFSGTAMSMNTTTVTTTAGSIWVSAPAGTATSSVILGGGEAGDTTVNDGCLELWREDTPWRIYVSSTDYYLAVEPGRCHD